MKKALVIYLLLFTQALITAHASSDEGMCLLPERQQQNLILREGPKALESETSNDCFNRLVKDEATVLKQGHSPIAEDHEAVIDSMIQSALHAQAIDKESQSE